MHEFSKDLIERIMLINGFSTDNFNFDEIQHVPMHSFKLATSEQPILFVEGLQCCVSLYAYSPTFAFAAHINPVVIRNDEIEIKDNKIYCKRLYDLYKSIIDSKADSIKVGVMLGFNPTKETIKLVNYLNHNLDLMIKYLAGQNITVTKLETKTRPIFLVDMRRDKIVTPSSSDFKQYEKRF